MTNTRQDRPQSCASLRCGNTPGKRLTNRLSKTYHDTQKNNAGGGGVAIFCKIGINFETITDLCYKNEHIETCAIQTKLAGRPKLILCVYKPPTVTLANFCAVIRKILTWKENNMTGIDHDMLGDFNLSFD